MRAAGASWAGRVSQDDQVELADYFLRGAARSSGKRQVIAKSVNQRKYLDAIDKHDVVFEARVYAPTNRRTARCI